MPFWGWTVITEILNKYGQSISLYTDSGTLIRTAKGFLQPLNQADTRSLWEMTPGGGVQREKYLLITETAAFDGTGAERLVVCGGKSYTVLRADKLDTPAGVSHWEAILSPEGRRLV